jgi:hypothetical protein
VWIIFGRNEKLKAECYTQEGKILIMAKRNVKSHIQRNVASRVRMKRVYWVWKLREFG